MLPETVSKLLPLAVGCGDSTDIDEIKNPPFGSSRPGSRGEWWDFVPKEIANLWHDLAWETKLVAFHFANEKCDAAYDVS